MNVFWSTIPLAKARRARSDHLSAHRTVMGLFPPLGESPRAEAGVLFRVEPAFSRLLIQSSTPPSEDQLDRLGGECKTVDVAEVAHSGRTIRYRVDVAAVRRRGRTERRLTTEEIPEWWEELAGKSGLALHGDPLSHLQGVTERSAKGPQPHLRVAQLDGVAEVSEPDELLRSLTGGIGRARSYGCGLLTAIAIP